MRGYSHPTHQILEQQHLYGAAKPEIQNAKDQNLIPRSEFICEEKIHKDSEVKSLEFCQLIIFDVIHNKIFHS